MRVWRLSKYRDPADAFSGEGARRYAARWHPAGVAIVYTASSLALAALESLVHTEIRHRKTVRYYFSVDVPDALIELVDVAALPPDWSHPTTTTHARAFVAAWVTSGRSLGLAVPSVVVPTDRNLLLNPAHPAFATLPISGSTPFHFDSRLAAPPGKLRKPTRR